MKLSLKNIGKISTASVEIKGITVIGGENNTGKSTVSRALFAMFNCFYNIEEKISAERTDSIQSVLKRTLAGTMRSGRNVEMLRRLGNRIARKVGHLIGDEEALSEEIRRLLHLYDDKTEFKDDEIDELITGLKEVFAISDDDFLKTMLGKRLGVEFNDQVCNFFSRDGGEIQLEIKNERISARIENETVVELLNPEHVLLHTEAIYIDDPFVLDEPRMYALLFREENSRHGECLKDKLFSRKNEGNIFQEIIAREKLDSIYEKISSVCSGELVRDRQIRIGYQGRGSDKVLDVRNLSAGLKTFVILKTLLTNGSIERNGVVILDEPEIHLHPEWQLLLAELIVLIQKEFGLHVLLNTHSPYFLRAIQVYSAKYETADRCKYYLSERDGDLATITDVTDDIDKIYAKLFRPLQRLENERWQDD